MVANLMLNIFSGYFNVRTLMHTGQQTCLILRIDNLAIWDNES